TGPRFTNKGGAPVLWRLLRQFGTTGISGAPKGYYGYGRLQPYRSNRTHRPAGPDRPGGGLSAPADRHILERDYRAADGGAVATVEGGLLHDHRRRDAGGQHPLAHRLQCRAR